MPLPNMLTGALPQLVDLLLPRIADLFRKDTREMKAAVDAEIASLGRAQAELNANSTRQGESLEFVRTEVATLHRKMDQVLERQETIDRQLGDLQQSVGASRATSPGLLWSILGVSLLGFATALAALLLHR